MKTLDTHNLEHENQHLRNLDLKSRLKWAIQRFGDKLTLASSLGPQSIVLTCYMKQLVEDPDIFFLDTGRLPAETYKLLNNCMDHFGIKYRIFFPKNKDVEKFVRKYGPNGFYGSVDIRKECCSIRKVKSMKRALYGYDMWITGARADQTKYRQSMQILQYDQRYELYKFNPMADWTEEMVWKYIRQNDLPYNELHDIGYKSIGCAPCSRPVKNGDDPRSGRWWWEDDSSSECGMHILEPEENFEIVELKIPNIFEKIRK